VNFVQRRCGAKTGTVSVYQANVSLRKRPADTSTVAALHAVQLPLGHTKLESTVRYLGVGVEDALSLSEQIEL
jgi:hypothetical protein